jgi:phosphonate transport system substrate-binding protein
VFIARAGSGLAKLEDLRGRDFVFGASTSATGHLMPRYYLMQSGVDPRTDLAKFFFSGAHEATINHVAAGRASAGSLNLATWNRLVAGNRIDRSKVEAFYETGRFNDYLWAIRGDVEASLADRLRAAFLALDPGRPDEARVLELQRASRYIETRDSFYEPIGIAARAAGLLK